MHGTNKDTMKTASMMILPYLVLLAFTGLPVLASASDGEDSAASLLPRGEDIVISGGNRVKRRRKLKSTKSDCLESPVCHCHDACYRVCIINLSSSGINCSDECNDACGSGNLCFCDYLRHHLHRHHLEWFRRCSGLQRLQQTNSSCNDGRNH